MTEVNRDPGVLRSGRVYFGLCLAAAVILGGGAFLMRGTGFDGVANHAGGGFYVLAWIFVVLMFAPGFDPLWVCTAGLIGTCGIEFLQLWHPPALESARDSLVGRLLLGSTFSWSDFPAYGVGAVLGYYVATTISSRRALGLSKSASGLADSQRYGG